MSEETDAFLAHHGVLGQKWGQHRARAKELRSVERQGKLGRREAALRRIDSSNGSKGKAVAKVVGKNILFNILTNVGATVVSKAIPDPAGKNLVRLAAGGAQLGQAIVDGNRIYNIAKAKN